MPDGIPPFVSEDGQPEPEFNLTVDVSGVTDLDRWSRLVYSRRSGIALADLDAWFDVHPSELDELDRIMDSLRRPSWIESGVRVFEITEDPDGDIRSRGTTWSVVRSYSLHYVPNKRVRTSVYPWALKYGGRS